MYGFIYNTLRNLVVEKCDENTWIEICDSAGIEELKEGILDRCYYDESYIYTIGKEASKKLGVSVEDIMELFGAFFFKTCKKSGHSSILRTLGHNLYGFLLNLDTLHDHLAFTYTKMRAPSFRCEKTNSGLTLYYYSPRPGLSNIVSGIVKEVAKDFYSLDITVKQISYEETTDKLAHHYVFSIEVVESAKNDNYLERLTGEINSSHILNVLPTVEDEDEMVLEQPDLPSHPLGSRYSSANGLEERRGSEGCPLHHLEEEVVVEEDRLSPIQNNLKVTLPSEVKDLILQQMTKVNFESEASMPYQMPRPYLPALSMSRIQSRRGSMLDVADWPVNVQLFQHCFPFHVIFDRDMVIRYMGVSLARLLPKGSRAVLTDYFDLERPKMAFSYHNIRTSLHNNFVIVTKPSVVAKGTLYFRGQMVLTSRREGASILFLCSPRVNSMEELEHQGLYLSDIPVHDVTRDLLLLNRHFRVEMTIAKELEETKKDLVIQKARVEQEKQRADQLLHTMLPSSVASELKGKGEATAINYSSVTILFSDIKGFTTICNSCRPMQVVGMLNSLYTLFDHQSEYHKVYKVETIGDAYMVAAGLLDTPTQHAEAVTNMAFGMMEEAGKVMEPTNLAPLEVRIGIHTGPVVAGVVGRRMPRYCLFGDTVNTASRMESHGEPGKVHISPATYSKLDGNKHYKLESRGEIPIKGLGMMQTYFVYPTNPIVTSLDDDADALPIKIASMEDISTVSELHQCQLVKLPAKTRRQTPSSPFSDKEGKGSGPHSPAIMDMVKPQLDPIEGAWKTSPSPSSPRPSQVSPKQHENEEGGDQQEQDAGPRKSPELFIASSDPQQATVEQKQQRTSKSKKCVVC